MEVTIKCSPTRVLIQAGREWIEIPEENVPYLALHATVKENRNDDTMVLEYTGDSKSVLFQYRSTWVEKRVSHTAWVTARPAVVIGKPFFVQKRVLFTAGTNYPFSPVLKESQKDLR